MTVTLLLGSHASNLDVKNPGHRFLPDVFRFRLSWTGLVGEGQWVTNVLASLSLLSGPG